jgi:hypothetical protein
MSKTNPIAMVVGNGRIADRLGQASNRVHAVKDDHTDNEDYYGKPYLAENSAGIPPLPPRAHSQYLPPRYYLPIEASAKCSRS